MSGERRLDLSPGQMVTVPPGGVVVVGPRGELTVGITPHGVPLLKAVNCDFIGPVKMSAAHRALVDERWSRWADDGSCRLPEEALAELDALLTRAAPDRPAAAAPQERASGIHGTIARWLRRIADRLDEPG